MSEHVQLPIRGGFTLIDAADLPLIEKRSWRLHKCKDGHLYARATESVDGASRTLLMHRVLMELETGDPLEVDHRDGNGLNNTRMNLRIATRAQNAKNRKPQANRHGFKGVMWDGWAYRGRIYVDGRRIAGPAVTTAVDAAAWYDQMSMRHYGEFAAPNGIRRPG